MTTPTPKYSYKGTDISNLIDSGTTELTNYTGFPKYVATNYAVEKPLPFNITTPTGDVSQSMKAKFFTGTTYAPPPDTPLPPFYPNPNPPPVVGGTPYTPPIEGGFTKFRAVLIGGGGGGGNGGSCGWSGSKRHPGGGGRIGGYGGVTVVEGEIPFKGKFWYSAGEGGNQTDGSKRLPPGIIGNGANGGTGNFGKRSILTFYNNSGHQHFVYANGGEGGGGGHGGREDGPSPGCFTPINVTNPQTPIVAVINPPITVASPEVAYFTSNTTPPLGYANVYGNGGPGTGSPGLVQIYLLKD
jgi:hypothetical protein